MSNIQFPTSPLNSNSLGEAKLLAEEARSNYTQAQQVYETKSREDFQIRLQRIQEQPLPSLQPGSPNSYFDHPKYVSLPSPGGAVVRPLTNNDPSSPVKPPDSCFFHSSFIRGLDSDNQGRKFPISYGFKPWFKHPLYKMISVIAQGEWDANFKTMYYDHAGHPLLNLILTNNEPTPYPLGWRGTKMVLLNVIDREDTFCQLNRQSKVLVKSASYNESWGNWVSSYGVPPIVPAEMKGLSDEKGLKLTEADFLVFRHHWEKPKVVEGRKKYYEVFIQTPTGPLTEEEKSYKMYYFSSMPLYQPSNMIYILSMLSDFIQEADKEFPGHNFKEEFLEIAESEAKVNAELSKEAKTSTSILVPEGAVSRPPVEGFKIPKPKWKTIQNSQGALERVPFDQPEPSEVNIVAPPINPPVITSESLADLFKS